MRRLSLLAPLLTAVILAGCGSSATPIPSSEPTPAATEAPVTEAPATPAPSTGPDLAALGARYAQIADDTKTAADTLIADVSSAETAAAAVKLYKQAAAAIRKGVNDLKAVEWTEAVQPYVTRLQTNWAQLAALYAGSGGDARAIDKTTAAAEKIQAKIDTIQGAIEHYFE